MLMTVTLLSTLAALIISRVEVHILVIVGCFLFLFLLGIGNWLICKRIQRLEGYTQQEQRVLMRQSVASSVFPIFFVGLIGIKIFNLDNRFSFLGLNPLQLLTLFIFLLPYMYISISAIKNQLYFVLWKGGGIQIVEGEWAVILGIVQIGIILPFVIPPIIRYFGGDVW